VARPDEDAAALAVLKAKKRTAVKGGVGALQVQVQRRSDGVGRASRTCHGRRVEAEEGQGKGQQRRAMGVIKNRRTRAVWQSAAGPQKGLFGWRLLGRRARVGRVWSERC
jgi:hypothetical protein